MLASIDVFHQKSGVKNNDRLVNHSIIAMHEPERKGIQNECKFPLPLNSPEGSLRRTSPRRLQIIVSENVVNEHNLVSFRLIRDILTLEFQERFVFHVPEDKLDVAVRRAAAQNPTDEAV